MTTSALRLGEERDSSSGTKQPKPRRKIGKRREALNRGMLPLALYNEYQVSLNKFTLLKILGTKSASQI